MQRLAARVLCVAVLATVAGLAQTPGAVTLTVEENANSPVVLHAAVEPPSASGTVTFYSGTTILGIAPVRFGKADLAGAKLPPGHHLFSAIYSGDLAVGRARSGAVRHVSRISNALADPVLEKAVADFNGDGRDDIAVANASGDTVSVILSGENGTFGPEMMSQTGAGPVALVVADFNGDGRADLATANRFGKSISILLGRGDGTFQPPTETALDREPTRLVVGDFNGDGVADVAFDGGWLPGGSGPVVPLGRSEAYRELVAADLNGDGISDLAALKNGQIDIFLGQKDGFSKLNPLVFDGNGLTWGDIDGDGEVDLVGIDPSGATRWARGNGDGTFGDFRVMPVATESGTGTGKPSRTTAKASPAYILSTADSGPGSLREAVQNGSTPITFGFNNTQITLTSGPITVPAGVTIDGTGGNITISGNNQSRIFVINGDGVTIKGLTLANGLAQGGDGANGLGGGGGAAGMGGAVFVVSGANVKFDHVTFNNNKAQGGKGGSVAEGNSGVGSSANGGGGGGGLGGNGTGPSYAPFDFVSNDHGGNGGGGGILGGGGGSAGYLKTVDTGSMIEIVGAFGAASTLMELSEAGSAFQLGLITVKAALTNSGVGKVKEIIGNFTNALTVITLTTYPGNGGPGAGGGGGGNYQAIGAPGGFGGGGGSAYWSIMGLARQPGSTAAHTHGGAGGFGGGQGGGTITNGAGIGGDGYGGAVFVYAGTTIFDTCTFSNNTAAGGANGVGSFGTNPDFGSTSAGAAVYVNDGASGVYPTTGLPQFSNNTSAQDRTAAGGFGQQGGNGNPVVLDAGDSGFGTLRWAVGQVSNGGTIRFGANLTGQTIPLQSQLTIAQSMTIDGESRNVSISGNNQTRIFLITGGSPTIQRLTLKNGYAKGGNGGSSRFGGGGAAGLGGAVLILGGTVTVDTVTFTGNRAQGGSGGNGVAIDYSAGVPANYGGGGGGGLVGDGDSTTATTGGTGGSSGDVGGAAGKPGPTTSFSVISSQNGGGGGVGAGGGGGASGLTQVSSTAVQKGGDGGTGGVGGGGGGAGYEVCAVTTFPSATCPSSPATARGGFGGLLGGGGGAGYKSGPGGMFGGTGGSNASAAVGGGGAGLGGAICLYTGTLNLSASTFTANTATGGSGAQRGQGKGGGLFFYPYNGGTLNWVTPSTFSGNTAQDSTTNPTDSDQIYGATVNGAPAQILLTSTILQSQTFEQVVNLAPAGSIITFAAALSGRTIAIDNALTVNRDLTIDGTLGGAKNIVLVPGATTGRAFCVTGGNFTLRNLTIANFVGNGVFGGANCGNGGGALRNDGGTVAISNVAFLSNGGPVPSGGALYQSAGSMTLSASRFDGNLIANAADPGTNVAILGGTLTYGGTNTFNVPVGYNAQTVYLLSGSPIQRAAVRTTVTTTDPTGPGSLEEAVTTSPSGSTIVFSLPDNSTITTNSELFIGGDLTIDGGAGVAISGNDDHRIFFIQSGKVAIKNLTLKKGLAKGGDGGDAYAAGSGGGGAGVGGAVFQNGGALSLSNVTFANNNAKGGAGGSNLTLGDGRGFVSNADYTRGGSGGGGATFKGDATNSGLPSGRSWARGGLGGMLMGENGGDGGKPSFGAQSLGAVGGFAAGGGGGGNDATAAGKGGAGGFGGGGGSAGAGPNPAHGAPGTFGGTPTAGMGGGGAGLGGGLFVRSGSVTFASVTFSNNRAAASGFPSCNTDVCAGFPDTMRGLGKGGGIFLYTGVSATALGPIEFSGNIADNAAAGGSFIVNEGNFYGNLLLPTNLRSAIGSFAANIGRPFEAIGISLVDQNGNPIANVPVTFTFPGGGASIAGPPVVVATTGLNGVATFNLTANGTVGRYDATATVGSITLLLSFTNRAAEIPNSFVVVAGSPQSAAVGSTFATPIRILAKDTSGNPVPYSSVKFYCCFAPGAGNASTAGGTFAGSATLVSVATDSNGEAVAPAFTANLFTGSFDAYVGNTFATGATPGNGQALRLTNTAAPPAKITASSGTPQSAVYNTAFGAQLKALVTDANSIPVPNVSVTFSAPDPNTPPGVSGTFAGGGAAAVVTTDALGIATAPIFTANGNIGPYAVTAAATGVSTPTSFSLENIPSATASIAAQSGTGQTATISTAFEAPLTAIVRDSAGHPVRSATVLFTAPASGVAGATFGNGSRTMSVLTDANGLATVSVKANSMAGSYTITGTSPGATTSATYDLTNTSSTAAQISIVQGDSESVRVLLSFQSTQRVKITDNGGNAVAGINVVFSLPSSGASGTFPDGSILASVTTTSAGTATAPQVTANAKAGSYVMSATAPVLSGTVNFNFTNLVGQPESLTLTAGGNQSVAQGAVFPTRFTVVAKDPGGNLVPNAAVLFSVPFAQPTGTFSGNSTATVNTDSNGIATAPVFTAGSKGGSYQVAVSGGSAPVLYIDASNQAGAPALITAVAGTGQTTTVLTAFATALKVKVTDNAGLNVSGATVTFTAPSTGPSLTFSGGSSTATATTDSNGEATAPAITANGAAGSFGVTVSTGSVSVSYGYTNTAGSAGAASIYAGNNQSAPLSTSFTTPLQVMVTDASGNPISNVNVTFAAPTTGATGTFGGNSSTTVKTAASGIASATLTSNSTLGSYSVTATPAGLSALTFTMTNSSPLVTSLTATSGTGQTAVVGGAFGSALVANVTATPSSARANVSVTFTLPASGASATFPGGALTATALTDGSGNATSPALTANGTTGSFNVVVSVNALTASYTLQNTAYTAGTSSILLPASSGSSSVQIAIGGSFSWTASADQNWITFTTGSGTGSGTVRFTYTANSSASPRTATITAGGVPVSVTQAGSGYLQVRPVKRLVSGLDYSYAVAADPAGNVYYNRQTTFPNSDTYQWSAATGLSTKLPLSLQLIYAMAYDPRGNLVIGDLQTGTVKSLNLSTNAVSTVSNLVGSDLRSPTGVAVNGNGDIFAIHTKVSDSSVGTALKVGGYQTGITGLTLDPYNAADITGAQYVTTGSNIRTFNAAGQLQSTPITASNPSGIAVDGLGMLYYADTQNGVLYQYNPQTAQATALADLSDVNVAPDGFTWLQQVAVDAMGLNVYFADSGNPNAPGSGAIWRHSTGYFAPASTSLSVSTGSGTLLYSVLPAGFAIEATSDADWLTITGAANGAITFTTASNTTGSSRTGHILVYGQSITVTQGSNSVTKQAGDAQTATVGAAFGTALQVKVTAANGSAVNAASVSFAVTAGPSGASAAFSGSAAASATTNSSGLASAPTLTANTIAGTFTVTATSNGVSTAFTLTNTAAASASITAVAGTPQSSPLNLAFGTQLKAMVKDTNGNPRSGVSVTFAAPGSGASGTFASSATVSTDSTGTATAPVFTANGTTGSYTVTASTSGVATPASFSLTNSAATANSMAVSSGDGQTATVLSAFASPLAVLVKDVLGNPVQGVTVTFTAPGSGAGAAFPNGNTAATNASGIATSPAFSANGSVGSYTVTATAANSTASASFSLTNKVGPAASIAVVSGTPQSAGVSTSFAALSVVVKDVAGNVAPNTTVTFTAPPASSGATADFSGTNTTTAITNSSGVASVTPSANRVLGAYAVSAQVTGVASTVTFTLTNTIGAPASATILSGAQQTAPINTRYGSTVSTQFFDVAGNPTPNVNVQVTPFRPNTSQIPCNSGSGIACATFSAGGAGGTGGRTNAQGIFTTTAAPTANGVVGDVAIWVTSGSVTVITTFTNTAGSAASASAISGAPQSATINTAFATPLKVQVVDSSNNGTPGVKVTFSVPASGASASFIGAGVVTTDSSGVATANLQANSVSGTYNVTATVEGVATPVTFTNLTNTAGTAASIAVTQGATQSAAVGNAFGTLQAKVTDSAGNPVQGATVTFAAPGSGASGSFSGGATAITNSSGLATAATFTANTTAGAYVVTASVPGAGTAAQFSLTNTPGAAAALTASAGGGQSASALTAFGILMKAALRDAYGNGIPGTTVTFAAPGSGASGSFASGNTAVTDSTGVATAPAFTANGTLGSYAVTATAAALSTTFPLTNTVGAPASITASGGTPQSATVGTAFGSALQAVVRDAANNPVPNATVTFGIQSGSAGATFGGSNVVTTNSAGVAVSPTLTANSVPGSYSATATVTGLTGAPATFGLTNLDLISVTVGTSPAGLAFTVDGTPYAASTTFRWAPGSNHTVATVATQQNSAKTAAYAFGTWSDSGALSHTYVTPSSAPSQPLTANFTATGYVFQVGPGLAVAGSVVDGAGKAYPTYGQLLPAGSTVTVRAAPSSGYTFARWTYSYTDTGDTPSASNPLTFVLNGPKNMVANFNSGSPSLTLSIVSKSLTAGVDTWTVKATNSGQGTATAQITGITLSPAATVSTALPISLGTIAPGGTAQASFSFNLPSTLPFTMTITLFDGVNTKTVTFSNLRL
jgi:hypothetical protein